MSDLSDPYDLADEDPVAKPSQAAPPLPRMHKTAPLTEAEAEAADKAERRAAGLNTDDLPKVRQKKPATSPIDASLAPKKSAKGGEKAGVLKEETPNLDTVGSRQAIRIGVGVGGLALVGFIGLMFARSFKGEEPPPANPDAEPPVVAPRVDPSEREADQILADARQFGAANKPKLAEDRLNKVLKLFPKTRAAEMATAALDRRRQNMPYFLEGPAVVAEAATPLPEPPPPPMVVAEPPVAPPGTAVADVRSLAHPAEPRRPTGLAMERADVAPRPLPEGFRPRTDAGVHPSGWPLEVVGDKDGGTLMLVPGGTATIGRGDGPINERPSRQVALPSFYIAQHEVTTRQFAEFRDRTGTAADPKLPMPDDRPAVMVSYKDAAAYAAWAGLQLPTEPQWEMAARATDSRPFPQGPKLPEGWKREPRKLDLVMAFGDDLSPYGVYDLAGNAWEWTGEPFESKRGSKGVAQRIVKGTSKTWHASGREPMKEETRLPYLGFRCVLNVEGSAAVPVGPSTAVPAGSRPPAGNGAVPF